jgi:SPP1 gp7 family putative phage head morphogenesis protein
MVTAPRVTADERKLAQTMDRDKRRVAQLGIAAAGRIGFRAQSAAVRAARAGGHLTDIMHHYARELWQAAPLLASAMAVGHLVGRERSDRIHRGFRQGVALASGAFPGIASVYDPAADFVLRRLEMDDEDLNSITSLYRADALRVLKTTTEGVEQALERAISSGLVGGEHVKGGVALLRDVFDAQGMTPVSSFQLESIFRTQTAIAYGAGRWNAAQDPDIDDIIWGYKYVTVHDDRVREEHRGFDGVTYPKDDPFWTVNWPPCGWACRCNALTITEPREIVHPRAVENEQGEMVTPESAPGFAFNPGMVYRDHLAVAS